MTRRGLLASLLGLLAAPAVAQAQTHREQRPLYRCGNTLSDRPCAQDATASSVAFDQPSDADRRAAGARTQAEQRRTAQQTREREAAEREALRANRAPAPPPSKPSATSAPAEPRVRHSRGPKPRPPKAPAPPASG